MENNLTRIQFISAWYRYLEYKQLYKDLGRNNLCGCGSGKKYKKCCLEKYSNISYDMVFFDKFKADRLTEKQMDDVYDRLFLKKSPN